MVLRFQRVRSFLGSASTMKVYINGEVVGKLKNGEVFEFETDSVNDLLIKTHRFIIDLSIPTDQFKEKIDILLQYQYGLCKTKTQAIVSENGRLIGVFPSEKVEMK